MVLPWKRNKPKPLRNLAVQTVGESYFVLGMIGMAVAGVLAIASVASGSTRGIFRFRLDRCDCLLTSSSKASQEAGQSCIYGDDHLEVDIGWKDFVITEAVSTQGCLDDWEGRVNIGSPFGTGYYAKSTTSYGNGAPVAADTYVGIFVVSAILSIVMFKTIKMSYYGPGSIYTIGLHNMAIICFLLSVASGMSMAAFWGRIQGSLGSLDASLSGVLFKATIYVCEKDWNETEDSNFCDALPWEFEVPLYAGVLAVAHMSVMFITSVWLLTRSAFVEGLLDGSILASGKLVTPRVIEFEQPVGRALAVPEDLEYDNVTGLYGGERINIRPYPLPRTSKTKSTIHSDMILSPLRNMTHAQVNTPPKRDSRKMSASTSPRDAVSGEKQASNISNSILKGPRLASPVRSVQEEHKDQDNELLDPPRGFFSPTARVSLGPDAKVRVSTLPNRLGEAKSATNVGLSAPEQQLKEGQNGRGISQEDSKQNLGVLSTLSSLDYSLPHGMSPDHQPRINVLTMPREMASAETSNSVDVENEQSLGGINSDDLGDAFNASISTAFSETEGEMEDLSDRSQFRNDWDNIDMMCSGDTGGLGTTTENDILNANK